MRIIIFILLFFIFGCKNEEFIKELKIFRYNESSGINTLDPAFAKDQASVWATSQIFNGLTSLDSNLNVNLSIAKNYSISSDGLQYTFLLRDDVFFHDHSLFDDGVGRRVVAYDFEYSFNRLIDNELAAPGSWVLEHVNSFQAINDSVFEIILKNPFPAFLSLLSMQYCSVVPHEIVSKINFSVNPVGTGPFKFQMWKQGVKLVLRKNNNYFESSNDESIPYLDAVAITFIKDKQASFLEFIQGNLDFISGIDASYKDEILTNTGKLRDKYKNQINLQSHPYLNTEYLGFLMQDTLPLKVRKAINYGIDRVKMIRYLRNNIGTPAINGFIPLGLPSFTKELEGFNYDPDLSKRLLAESSFDLNTKIVLHTTSSYLDLCEYIQNQLLGIGLNVAIDVNPPSTHRQMVATSRLPFFRGSWIADYPDAENYLALFYSHNFCPKGPNYTHFKSQEFDSLYEKSFLENNYDERIEIYRRMDRIIIDQAVIVPLYYDKVLRFTQNNVIGFHSNAMNFLDLKRVRK